MDKLEAIKNELRKMIKQCELEEGCNGCIYEDKCNRKLRLDTPTECLETIKKCEKLLND